MCKILPCILTLVATGRVALFVVFNIAKCLPEVVLLAAVTKSRQQRAMDIFKHSQCASEALTAFSVSRSIEISWLCAQEPSQLD